ncbi:endo-alpha-N-acetylgalactosaminidase family protein [Ornithinibacillus gellani]|uniref:endo-alpha-N-acetylgalactosaminidase family protein n=1 Tax=Ornithinibacillus gellani TaxID=2293253 RepID=UPI001CC1ED97|nr:endo-alpha-N-acetylgalactosaminidase family protein [Ornithinibacillus gellani]
MKRISKKIITLLFACMLVLPGMINGSGVVLAKDAVNADEVVAKEIQTAAKKQPTTQKTKAAPKQVLSLKEGDAEVIQGDAELTYNEDGSLTFGVTSTGKNKVIFNHIEDMKDGIIEADIKADKDLSRFGFIYRVQDDAAYKYTGTADQNNLYFSEIFAPVNEWTSNTKGTPLKANQTYHLRLKFVDDVATLYVDDEKIGSWSQPNGLTDAGAIGFEKSRGAANITISNVQAEEYVAPTPPDKEPVEATLQSDYMDVTIDENFPRIIQYAVGNHIMVGQETPVHGIKVNNELYYPEVSFEQTNDSEALYTMTFADEYEDIDATVQVSLSVVDNQVVYQFEDIQNAGDAVIETIAFHDLNLISADASQEGAHAKLTNLSSDVNKPGDIDVNIDEDMENVGTSASYYTAFLTTGELSAGVWSSSEVDGYKNLVASRYETEAGDKAMGVGSNTLYYHRSFMPEAPEELPSIKIALAEDVNDDSVVDWQDAAIAYRDIMQEIPGSENVNNNVGTRIAMNFGSQVQQPFLKTLDNIKKVSLATDNLGQAVLLKGYGNEGHDSAHPDYGDVGERMGGEADLKTLTDAAEQFNAEIGVHINAQETYPEAKAFNDDFIEGPGSLGWGWIDQGYVIDKIKDLASGTRAERLDQLKEAAPGLDFIYLDVWYQDQWESDRIAEQLIDRGWRVTTEFGTSVPNYSTWQHWATDKNYGGSESKGINSDVLRFISNHQKDSWVLNWPEAGGTADHPLLGGFELAGFEGWQSDKNFDQFIRMTFDTNIPTKFLQKYYVTNWEKVDGDATKTNLEQTIKLQDPSNDDKVVVERKENSRDRIITLNDNVVLDGHQYLLPWVEQDFENPTPEAEKLYHWNLEGGSSTWTLPEAFGDLDEVALYKLTDQGRQDKQILQVKDGKITIEAEAKTAYIVVATDDDAGVEIDDWMTGGHVHDTGFNTGTIDDDDTEVTGDEQAVTVKRTSQTGTARNVSSGDYYLHVDSPKEKTTVSRTIHNLEPGKDYVAEVYVENSSNEKASIQVTGGEEDVSNYTLRSLQKNYVKADSHATNDGYNSKMQRMQVSFTATSETATLTLGREAGEGDTKFDDIRIVQKTLHNQVSDKVFEQDFESVVQGIYPFVIGNTEGVEDNRIHLSELHAPYTQKGWAGKKLVDDVIDGNWSVKVNTGNSGLLYRTIPQHFRFEEGKTYKVSFDYQTTVDAFRFISGDEEIDVRNIKDAKGLQVNDTLSASTDTKTAEFTITGSDNGQTYIGIFSDGTALNMDTGAGTFILDNLRIETISDVESAGDLKDFVTALAEAGEISNDTVLRQLTTHLTAVERYEKTNALDKALKHLNSMHILLEHGKDAGQISESGYHALTKATDDLLKQWMLDLAAQAESASDIKEFLKVLENTKLIEDKELVKPLNLHLTAVERYEQTNAADKVIKHLNGFKTMIGQLHEADKLDQHVSEAIDHAANTVIQIWE